MKLIFFWILDHERERDCENKRERESKGESEKEMGRKRDIEKERRISYLDGVPLANWRTLCRCRL